MKAKVKATGKIIDVELVHPNIHDCYTNKNFYISKLKKNLST